MTERRQGESLAMWRARMKEAALAAERTRVEAYWGTSGRATPKTREHAVLAEQSSITRLFDSGILNDDQLRSAVEIARVAEIIERDVSVAAASWESRVDCNGSSKDKLLEGIWRVRFEMAYSWWRARLREPKRAVLDMIVGDPAPFSTVALRYRMGKNRARKLLLDSLDMWPVAVVGAEGAVDKEDVEAAHARLR